MKAKKPKICRPSADDTRESILNAARKLFVKKGFADTSISEIANLANINQSLIYHHFKDKSALWKQVKHCIVDQHVALHPYKKLQELGEQDLMTFLNNIVKHRFYLYWKNPDVLRIISWQRLEPSSSELHTSCYASPEEWCQIIQKLQSRGEIRKELSPEWVMIFITNAVAGLFIDHATLFHNKKKAITEEYLDMIISSLYRALR